MRLSTIVGANHPIRSWARRISRSTAARPDVGVEKLQRRLDVLEKFVHLPNQALSSVEEATQLLAPVQFEGLGLERFGSANDGGYVLPSQLATIDTGVISIGVGQNNDCDLELAQRGLRVWAWDHTITKLPRKHSLIEFRKTGLGQGVSLASLEEIVDASFGSDARELILLLDAEGAEWDALSSAPTYLLNRFKVISIEFHGLGDLLFDPASKMAVLQLLANSFAPIAVHANNHGAIWRIGEFDWPDALEVTYVRRTLASGEEHPGNCSSSLLAPCCADLPDQDIQWLRAKPIPS